MLGIKSKEKKVIGIVITRVGLGFNGPVTAGQIILLEDIIPIPILHYDEHLNSFKGIVAGENYLKRNGLPADLPYRRVFFNEAEIMPEEVVAIRGISHLNNLAVFKQIYTK